MAAYPETKALLARVHGDDVKSPEFAAHAFRVSNAYGVLQLALGDTKVVQQIASHLARQHEKRIGVKLEHFKVSITDMKVGHFRSLHEPSVRSAVRMSRPTWL